jgi:hypothetical protein
MAVFLQRDVVLHITPNVAAGTADSVTYKMPIQEGFSFSQATNASEVTLSEMESSAGTSRRGRRMFNDSLAPAEWSFTTYIRPFKSNGTGTKNHSNAHIHAVEECLWNALLAQGALTEASTTARTTSATGSVVYDSTRSNKAALNTITMEFQFATGFVYKLNKCVVNTANISFDVDGIAQVEWSGFAETIEEKVTTLTSVTCQNSGDTITKSSHGIANGTLISLADFSGGIAEGEYYVISTATNTFQVSLTSGGSAVAVTADGTGGTVTTNGTIVASTIEEGQRTSDTSNYLRNRLTQLVLDGDNATNHSSARKSYSLTLTGGNISIDNGINYLTPDTLGSVNTPLEHITGPRNVSGAFTCYLAGGKDTSQDFWQDMAGSGQRNIVTNNFDITFKIGGTTSPYCNIQLPKAHVEIPTHSIEDVISLETSFNALPTDLDSADDVTITMVGPLAAAS